MSWRSIVITQHAKLSYSSRLMMVQTVDGISEIPIEDIALVVVATTQAVVTTALIAELALHNVKVIFVDHHHQPVCETCSYYPSARENDLIIQQCNWSVERKKALWTQIIATKIENQLAVLRNYHCELGTIQDELNQLELGDTTNREAVVAQQYFKLLFEDFEGRRVASAINDSLNYGYSIILSEVNRAIAEWGYLTELGIHHHNQSNRFNLGSDLMEPFRPIIDYWVAGQEIQELTPDVKINLIDCVNLVIRFNGRKTSVRKAISNYVHDCLKYLSGDEDSVQLEMELIYEVPNDALNGYV